MWTNEVPKEPGFYWAHTPPMGSIGRIETTIVHLADVGAKTWMICDAGFYSTIKMSTNEMKEWEFWSERIRMPHEV